ncbi:hemin uptake protein HemP [Roseicyclus sp.]|uniref:hemin uptake protein HemP n=1 Tax=Roseicyclus sp. TaxID=1914329 RepID=UPI003F6B9737
MSYHDQITPTAEPTHSVPPRQIGPVYDARRLVDTAGTALIALDDKTYQLRITRAGKLILTK